MNATTNSELLRSAREARASAARFAAIVQRFGDEMPGHLDRLHVVLADIRHVASSLNGHPADGDAVSARTDLSVVSGMSAVSGATTVSRIDRAGALLGMPSHRLAAE